MSRVLEADDSGSLTIPPEVLGHSLPRARYVIETDGSGIHVEPENPAKTPPTTHDEWMRQWLDLAERIGNASTTNKSAIEILSEMRR